mmetsp:Transcript_40124/g.51686  ORF Transcript_40124/g.51686 Transcript_40124/m.51686 type:complete len:158 (+) Transcript_40124:828-1301(+)
MENLLVAVRNHPNIDLRCNTTAIDLLVEESTHSETSFNNLNPNNQDDESNTEEEEDRSSSSSSSFSSCTGAIILSQNGAIELVKSDNVILATGGCGDVYAHTSNPANARGDGVAMAIRAGAKVVISFNHHTHHLLLLCLTFITYDLSFLVKLYIKLF